MKLPLISIILILLCMSIVSADVEKEVLSNISCNGNVKVLIYGNTTCYMKGCSLNGEIWSCPCSDKTNLVIAAAARTEVCHATFEYTQTNTGARIVYPTITSWPEPPAPEEENLWLDISPFFKVIGFIVGGLLGVLVLVFIVIFAVKYIKKELEEDEKRNQ